MATRQDWEGRMGQEWARRGAALDRLLGPAGDAGLLALGARPGERVLDLGAGQGASTEVLADAVGPGGHVTAIDVSPDLMALARARLDGRRNVTLIEADAATHPFPEGAQDALFSRFGSLFFDDPQGALAHLVRALRPGSRAVFVAWQEPGRNQWASVPATFVAESGAGQGPNGGPGPFAWADPALFHPLLKGAGFRVVQHHPVEFMAEISEGEDPDPIERAVAFLMRVGPMASRLRGASEAARDDAAAFLRRRLQRHLQGDAVRLLSSAWVIEAHT